MCWTSYTARSAAGRGQELVGRNSFTRVSLQGEKLGQEVNVSASPAYAFSPALAWTGSEYGLAWSDWREGNSEIYFALLSSQGETLVPAKQVTTTAAYAGEPSLAWQGAGYGLAWTDQREGIITANDE